MVESAELRLIDVQDDDDGGGGLLVVPPSPPSPREAVNHEIEIHRLPRLHHLLHDYPDVVLGEAHVCNILDDLCNTQSPTKHVAFLSTARSSYCTSGKQ